MRLLSGRPRGDSPMAAGPRVERFDRLSATATHALLRLVAGWPDQAAPEPGEDVALVAVIGGAAERGERLPAPPAAAGASWQASFAMAVDVAADPEAVFVLERGEDSWTLPGPVDVDGGPPPLPERADAGPAELRRELVRTRDLLADREAELEEAQEAARMAYQHAHEARLERSGLMADIEEREAALQERDARIAALVEENDRHARDQVTLEALVATLEEKNERGRRALERAKEQAEAEAAAGARSVLAEARRDLAARDGRIQDLEMAVERARLAMTAAEQAAEEGTRTQAALQADAQRREGQLEELREELETERATVAVLSESLDAMRAASEGLEAQLAELAGEVDSRDERIAELEAELSRAQAELEDAREQIERAGAARAEVEEALAEAESELTSVHDELTDARALVAREEMEVGDLSERDDESLADLFNAARRAYTEKWGSDSSEAARWRAIALAAVEEAMRRPDFANDDESGEHGLANRVRRRRRQRLLAPLADARAEALESDDD